MLGRLVGAILLAPWLASAAPALGFAPYHGTVHPDAPWLPASLTKLMTAYVTFEALKAGTVSPDTKVICSQTRRGRRLLDPVKALLSEHGGLRQRVQFRHADFPGRSSPCGLTESSTAESLKPKDNRCGCILSPSPRILAGLLLIGTPAV
jgi:hypothetical protein